VTFRVRNTGYREGTEVAQVYAQLPVRSGEKFKRLVGWKRVTLAPGAEANVTVTLDRRALSVFDTENHKLEMLQGNYAISVGSSSHDTPLTQPLVIRE
jgi:beta-glucosidase